MLLLIDNYDSFVYNIYQYCSSLGHTTEVIRNDKLKLADINRDKYRAIIVSPGPGRPDEAGVTKDIIAAFAGKIPILGICLGHQAIAEVFGGKVVLAPQPVHGKVTDIYHDGQKIYAGLPHPIAAGRYHSLLVDDGSLPDCLAITATTDDGLIMGIRHKNFDVEGIQFHPESILTPQGYKLLNNFLS